MESLNTKITGGTLTAAEWNQPMSELQNIIEDTGQTLSAVDLNQLGKGLAHYVARGAFYTDSGAANAYVLSAIGNLQSIQSYEEGQSFAFIPDNPNAAGSNTINIVALGVKDLKDENGDDLVEGDLRPTFPFYCYYDSVNDEVRRINILTLAQQINFKSGRINKLVNGDFLINQRGIVFSTVADAEYTSDQWQTNFGLDGGTLDSDNVNVDPFAVGQTDVPNNPRNFFSFTHSITGASGDERVFESNNIEDLKQFSGEEVTLSFWIKGSANGTARYAFQGIYGTGGSPSSAEFLLPADVDISVTTSWQKITRTFTVPDLSAKTFGTNGDDYARVLIVKQLGATAATSFGGAGAFKFTGTLSVSDVQLEVGKYGTDYERLNIGKQFALCQRYFQTFAVQGNSPLGIGRGTGSIVVGEQKPLPVEMRVTPTITPSSNQSPVWRNITGGGGDVGGAVNIAYAGGTTFWRGQTTVTCVNGGGYWADFGGFGHTINISAEL